MFPDLNLISQGLISALTFENIIIIIFATIIGIIFGALPGLTASMGIAIMIPVTFGMNPISGLLLLAAVYCGAIYGGSISAIMLKTPGTVAAAATTFDGYPMVQQGRAGEALGTAAFSSWFGGTVSVIVLLFFAPFIANMALSFGASEYACLGILGLVLIVTISMKNMVKGLISGVIGLLLGTVGMEPSVGTYRFVFGMTHIVDGIHLVPALIGLFSVSQILIMTETASGNPMGGIREFSGKIAISFKQIKSILSTLIRGSIIGSGIGALPGAGATIATFISYDMNKRASKNSDKYGTGHIEGVAATESANNGVTGGAFTTMLTLGIPGNEATAIMMGGLMILGLRPGPEFFDSGAEIAYGFIMGLFIANFIMLVLGLLLSKQLAKLVRAPSAILIVGIMVLSFIGSFAINNSIIDVYILFILGVLGYLMIKIGFSGVPIILGMILGPIIESNMLRALKLSNNDWTVFITRPISASFLIIAALAIIYPIIQDKLFKRRQNTA